MIHNNPEAVKWLEENYQPLTFASSCHGFLELYDDSGRWAATMRVVGDGRLKELQRDSYLDWKVLY